MGCTHGVKYHKTDSDVEIGLFKFSSDEVPERPYSNYATVVYSFTEFVIDFGKTVPASRRPIYKGGAMIPPAAAKELHRVLGVEIGDYEKKYGTIPDPPSEEKEGKDLKIGFQYDKEELDSSEDKGAKTILEK